MNDWVTLVLVVSLIVAILVGGWCVAERHRRLLAFENQLERLQAEIESLCAERDRLKSEGDALESDPFAWEAAVRERLGYIRKGEVIVRTHAESRT